MIQANELRILNKVQDGNGFIFDVVSIHDDGTVYCDFNGNEGDVWEFDKNNPCQGISLTEEILLKCGFVARGVFWFDLHLDDRTKLTLGWHPDGRIDFEMSINKIYFDISHIKYLHQLQNLYFILTNKELQINL